MPRLLPKPRRRKWVPLVQYIIRARTEALAKARKGRTFATPRPPAPPPAKP